MDNLLLTLIALLLVLLNGFFVAAEFAIVKLRPTQAEEFAQTRGVSGRVLRSVRGNLDAYLSACQLGITLASLGLGWIGEPAVARLIEPGLRLIGVTSSAVVHGVALSVAFAIISFFHIVLGELAPKSLAIRKPEPVSLGTAIPLWAFYWAMYPFIRLLNGSANLILRMIGVQLAKEGGAAYSAEEIRRVLLTSHRHGELGPRETAILVHGLELGELTVGDVMRPLADVVALDADKPLRDSLSLIRRTRYSRYPLFEGKTANLCGLLHLKDLIMSQQRLREAEDLRTYMRELPVISEKASLISLLGRFREGSHFAAVTNRQGAVVGFVTFEHVIEALVGPVDDEFSEESPLWKVTQDGYLGHGSNSLVSLEQLFGVEIGVEEVNSVGGLIMWQLGRLPGLGETVRFRELEIKVLRMEGPRIVTVHVRRLATS